MFSGDVNFLIAMPSLKSDIFSNTVILMAEYNEKGALGFIINMPTGTTAQQLAKQMNIEHRQPLDIPILFGGPVQMEFFWVIHSADFKGASTIKVHDQFHLTAVQEIAPLLNDVKCPEIYYVGVGYSGWGEKQLDREIEEGSWWYGEFDPKILFEVELDKRWEEAFKSLGADPEHLIDLTDPTDPVIN